MSKQPPKIGDWVCHDDANELQPHKASHKVVKDDEPRALHSRLKRFLSTFSRKFERKFQSRTSNAGSKNEEWIRHGRTLMRYDTPPHPVITGNETDYDNIDDSTPGPEESHEHDYSISTTLFLGSQTNDGMSEVLEERDRVDTTGEPATAPPPIPDRSTLRIADRSMRARSS